MRLASYQIDGVPSYGLIDGSTVIDAGRRLKPDFPSLKHVLSGAGRKELQSVAGDRALAAPLTSVQLLPVIPDAGKIFNVLQNYETARLSQGRPKLQHPHFLVQFADTLVGSGTPIIKPKVTAEFDFEGEIAVIIARPGRAIAAEQALDYVAGYACYSDATPRDWMRHTRHFTAAKNFPATVGFGPWMLTADEVETASDLKLTTRVNGNIMQTGDLGDLSFSVSELIAYISTFTKLDAGDVIATGTPGGSGFRRIPPVFLKAADVVEVEVAGIGILRNEIADEQH